MHKPIENVNPIEVLSAAAAGEYSVGELFHLPAPEESELPSIPIDEVPGILKCCGHAMVHILRAVHEGDLSIDDLATLSDGTDEAPLWSGALCAIALYHDASVSRICCEARLGEVAGLSERTHIDELLDMASKGKTERLTAAAYLLARYLQAYHALFSFRERAKGFLGASVCLSLLRYAFSPIGDFPAFARLESVYPLNGFVVHAAKSILTNLSAVCDKVSNVSERGLDRLLSSLSASDLRSLADRSPEAAKLVGGEKHIETVFERRLAFLMQSFGFLVSPARKGEKGVDLVCVCGSRKPYTILLEAKTSRRDYFLPAKDARAMQDYADTAQMALSTIPAPELLLVVGPSAARTLAAKLRGLEASIKIPIRYCDASLLADLRRRLPGPVPAQQFLRALKLSAHVVEGSVIDAIVYEYEREQASHDQFVQQMLTKGAALDQLLKGK